MAGRSKVEVAFIISTYPMRQEQMRIVERDWRRSAVCLNIPCWAYDEESYDCHPMDVELLKEEIEELNFKSWPMCQLCFIT